MVLHSSSLKLMWRKNQLLFDRTTTEDILATPAAKNMAVAYDAASRRMEVTETVKEVQQLVDAFAEEFGKIGNRSGSRHKQYGASEARGRKLIEHRAG
ncbi:hypothetical protein WJX74_001129 [Apatococcus lobatus]|uniref:Uncharacterized protein n=1 Tax=Apatococcus lobatus TaxID=904363 RepID=A0AAW1REI5_9CHLO